eukprot:m51a1_g14340 hypothetical protein (143) ;mRNA; r:160401-160829
MDAADYLRQFVRDPAVHAKLVAEDCECARGHSRAAQEHLERVLALVDLAEHCSAARAASDGALGVQQQQDVRRAQALFRAAHAHMARAELLVDAAHRYMDRVQSDIAGFSALVFAVRLWVAQAARKPAPESSATASATHIAC